jgi:hypothetical protein
MVKNNRTIQPAYKQAATEPSGYRVGSVAKTGRARWAYDELLTIDEAKELAASSRLSILDPGRPPARLLPLSPAAVQRLAKMRAEYRAPVTCVVYAVVIEPEKILKTTESQAEAETYRKAYGEYHNGAKTATIRKATVTF